MIVTIIATNRQSEPPSVPPIVPTSLRYSLPPVLFSLYERSRIYGASKAAEWSLTNDIRIELRPQGTLVVGVYAGYIDTAMTANRDVPKVRPEEVARKTIEGIAIDQEEVFADRASQEIKAALAADPQAFYQYLQENWNRAQQQGK
jgi:NAD(P)-dependent dehydrogenase (short-subunit alcohol dehydrogenase family)